MRIKDSLTGEIKEFEPLKPPKVNIYTCGVTVYDECHIGHARSLYVFDVVRRYLEYRKFKVNFVRNITDIDDKIINRANELKIDWKELVNKYIDRYREDLKSLNINFGILDKDGEEPRATKNVENIKKYIKELIKKEYAYVTDSGVYFSVRKFKDYGKLSNQNIDKMEIGARVSPGENKKDPLDFALWKKAKEGEPSWKSPWGNGRPGWHIECSVMSQKYLKTDTLDIHAGGRDLIFPHHENEIAQSEAKTGKPFAKYWMHHGLLTINGQKMSKSLGNFITVKDALKDLPDKNAADILKVFFLSAHYSKPIDFSDKAIRDAREAVHGLLEPLNREPHIKDVKDIKKKDGKKYIDDHKRLFEIHMDNDFNTPQALADVFGLVRYCNYLLGAEKKDQIAIQYTINMIKTLCSILGLSLNQINTHDQKWGDLSSHNIIPKDMHDIDNEIQKREQLRKEKKYKEADEIRKQLEKKGIIVKDTEKGPEWEWR